MQEACDFLARGGLFRDARQAAGSLYTAAKRAGFISAKRGVYRVPDTARSIQPETSDGNGLSVNGVSPPKHQHSSDAPPILPDRPTETTSHVRFARTVPDKVLDYNFR